MIMMWNFYRGPLQVLPIQCSLPVFEVICINLTKISPLVDIIILSSHCFGSDSSLMPKAPTANSCVKCTLSSLGCSLVLRGAIDDLVVRIHAVAVRGTHLANHIIAQIVSRTASSDPLPDLPDVFNHSWWQQCFKAAANPKSGKIGRAHV